MMKRTGTPWMPADRFGRSLAGVGINLLVSEVARSVDFVCTVFSAIAVYSDEDFAVVDINGTQVLLHADHAYNDHPYSASVKGQEARGAGLEIRLYEVDPDTAEAAALNKPHGLREVYLLDPDGYCWVASRPLPA